MKSIVKHKFILILIFFFFFNGSPAQDAYDLTREMFKRTKQVSTVVYEMRKMERINGELVEQRSKVKFNKEPFNVYVKQLYPKEGVEVLFKKGANDNMALVNPNGFPWINLNLDPYGKTIRRNQHHTLMQTGFDHVINILEYLFIKYDSVITDMVSLGEEKILHGRRCRVIRLENPYFKYIPYTVSEGENLDSIASKFMISQYMIMEKNEGIDDFNDVYAGQEIIIPNDYSPKMVLYIDIEKNIPALMKIYDEEGLYEHYEYLNVSINPKIHPDEFSPDFSEYDF